MAFFTIEHSKAAYRADFLSYGITVIALGYYLFSITLPVHRLEMIILILTGLLGWTLIEYALHRFVLHKIQPFRRWHVQHHQRPNALICTPTLLSATLIAALVFLPTLLLGNVGYACALTLGLLAGYLAYAITHHAIHHWHSDSTWLKRRKHWHARHHQAQQPVCYGVTSAFWDQVCGSTVPTKK